MKKLYQYLTSFFLFIILISQVNAQSTKQSMKAGKAFMGKKQYDAAIQSFTEAITLKGTLTEAYVQRGKAYENLNKFQEAVQDYVKAHELDPDDEKVAYDAGRMFSALGQNVEAIHLLNYSIEKNINFLPAYYEKIECLITLNNYTEALRTCDKAIGIKESALNYYNRGMVRELLKNYLLAEFDYNHTLENDKNFKEAYIGLARVLIKQNRTDDALKQCNKVLLTNLTYTDAYFTRSEIYYIKSDLINAISDISKAITLDSNNYNYFFIRAGYYFEYNKSEAALQDYSTTINLNKENYTAYYQRALIYERLNKDSMAVADFNTFLELSEKTTGLTEKQSKAKQKIYSLNSESTKPEIVINSPVLNSKGLIEVALNVKSINIRATISDKSLLENIKINDKEVSFDKSLNKIEFTQEISLLIADKIVITASDIYQNISSISVDIIKTEIDQPVIGILNPSTNEYDDLVISSESPTLFIEGKISDESLIHSIFIDSVEAKFLSDALNPNFSATINIAGKTEILITAIDVFGNKKEKRFKLDRESAKLMAENPMGKTYAVFINNSDYEDFQSLEGPSKDVSAMRTALIKYDFHKVIVKKNLTKVEMERFFAIELRDMLKRDQVNSLLIWYAGHGKLMHGIGYWIPTDAKQDEEFSYFGITNLKTSIQSYPNTTTHVLVVTDACESGSSFYESMRGAKKIECGDYAPSKFKSSQVFSSAGNELAVDNSPFTKTFAKSLEFNPKRCISIDDIVVSVTESIGQGAKQSPKFGKIQGLEDENGTFFFIKKTN